LRSTDVTAPVPGKLPLWDGMARCTHRARDHAILVEIALCGSRMVDLSGRAGDLPIRQADTLSPVLSGVTFAARIIRRSPLPVLRAVAYWTTPVADAAVQIFKLAGQLPSPRRVPEQRHARALALCCIGVRAPETETVAVGARTSSRAESSPETSEAVVIETGTSWAYDFTTCRPSGDYRAGAERH